MQLNSCQTSQKSNNDDMSKEIGFLCALWANNVTDETRQKAYNNISELNKTIDEGISLKTNDPDAFKRQEINYLEKILKLDKEFKDLGCPFNMDYNDLKLKDVIRKSCVICKVICDLKCSECKYSHYCSEEHQKADWSTHKLNCALLKQRFIDEKKY